MDSSSPSPVKINRKALRPLIADVFVNTIAASPLDEEIEMLAVELEKDMSADLAAKITPALIKRQHALFLKSRIPPKEPKTKPAAK